MKILEIDREGRKTSREMTGEEQERFWTGSETEAQAAGMETALSEFAAALADPATNSIAKIRAAAGRFLEQTGGAV